MCAALLPSPAPPDAVPAAAAMAPVVAKKKRRRRALVRNPDSSRLYNLMLDVNALRSEVQRLEMSRNVMATRALVARENQRGAMLSTSAQVFEVFRYGFRPTQWRPSQHAVVAAAFDEHVAVSEQATGIFQLLEQWRMYSELFRMGVFAVSSLRVLVSDTDEGELIVEALGEFDGRMTHAALAVVFPHVVGHRELEQMLIGREFRCPTRTLLHFDSRGRITRFGANADMLAAVSQLVGRSPELAAALMAHARINEASMIDVVEDESSTQEQQDMRPNLGDDNSDGDVQEDEYGELVEDRDLHSRTGEGADDGLASHRQSVAFILS